MNSLRVLEGESGPLIVEREKSDNSSVVEVR